MGIYAGKFQQIEQNFNKSQKAPIDYQNRGRDFEKLFNEIFKKEGILIRESYHTSDNKSQQIDGAIEIDGKIFLLEIKWADPHTLPASSYFNFLGKIYSKIEGTLGLFISYNELEENFTNSIRNGLQQKCIVIHGSDDIMDIINEKVNIKDYVRWLYHQAAIDNVVSKSVTDFLISNNKTHQQANPSAQTINNIALQLIDPNCSQQTFMSLIKTNPSLLPEKLDYFADFYISSNNKGDLIQNKLDILLEEAVLNDSKKSCNAIIKMFSRPQWIKYSESTLCTAISKHIKEHYNSQNEINDIVKKCEKYLIDHMDDWEKENEASRIISIYLDVLPQDIIESLANSLIDIYADSYRKDHYDQKKLAAEIINNKLSSNRTKIIEDFIRQKLSSEKIWVNSREKDEESTISMLLYKYRKLPDLPNEAKCREIYDSV